MAVSSEPSASQSGRLTPSPPSGRWLVPLFVLGLVLVLLGERVVVTLESLSTAFSLLGVALVVVSFALRLPAALSAGRGRAAVEWLWAALMGAGVLGLGLYFASTPAGLELLGLGELERSDRDQVSAVLTVAWVVLIWLSVVGLVFAEAAVVPMRGAGRLEAPRVRSAAMGGLSLALASAYCALFVYAAGETGAQADYSYFKTSRPGESSRKLVASMTEPLKVTAFFPEVSQVRPEVDGYLSELLESATAASEYRVVDRYLEPKLAQEKHVFSDGVVVFERGSESQNLNIGTELPAARAKLKTLDRDVQQSLLKLVRARRIAYLTTGHGEINASSAAEERQGRSADLLKQILRKQNYQIRQLGLTQGLGDEVPSDAALVAVLGPTEPLAPEEVEALRAYADGGGRLLLALDSDKLGASAGDAAAAAAPDSAHLQALAGLVGLNYSPGPLVNERQHVRRRANSSDRALLVSNRFSSHASVSTLSRNSSRAAVILARSGALESAKRAGDRVDIALRALPGTFADTNGNYAFDAKVEAKKDLALAIAVSRPAQDKATAKPASASVDEAPEPKETRAFVLADADCFSDVVLGNFGPNRMLLIDVVRWLGGDESFVGEVVSEEDVRIEHTKQTDLVWFYATIFGAPLIVLGVGLAVARKRRMLQAEAS